MFGALLELGRGDQSQLPRRDGEDPHRPLDVLQGLLAEVGEREGELIAHLVVYGAGNCQGAWLANRFETRGEIHRVAEYIGAVPDNIADIDADAQLEEILCTRVRGAQDYDALDRRRAGDRMDDACKLHEQSVSRRLHDTASVGGDSGLEELASHRLERSQRTQLVGAEEAAVADDVRYEYGGEPALRGALGRGVHLSQSHLLLHQVELLPNMPNTVPISIASRGYRQRVPSTITVYRCDLFGRAALRRHVRAPRTRYERNASNPRLVLVQKSQKPIRGGFRCSGAATAGVLGEGLFMRERAKQPSDATTATRAAATPSSASTLLRSRSRARVG
jgi:hypothetical protein